MQRSPNSFIQTLQTWLRQGGWIIVLIVVYYFLGYGLFINGTLPGPYYVALYFHRIAFLLFWFVVVAFVPGCALLLLLQAFLRRRITWRIMGWSVGYMLAVIVLFFPVGGYLFEHGASLQVDAWNRSYHVSLLSLDDEGLLTLHECGPLKLLCHRIFSDCNNFGPRFQEQMSLRWEDDKLSFYNRNTLYYQRTRDETLFDFAEEYGIPSRARCRYSFWTS